MINIDSWCPFDVVTRYTKIKLLRSRKIFYCFARPSADIAAVVNLRCTLALLIVYVSRASFLRATFETIFESTFLNPGKRHETTKMTFSCAQNVLKCEGMCVVTTNCFIASQIYFLAFSNHCQSIKFLFTVHVYLQVPVRMSFKNSFVKLRLWNLVKRRWPSRMLASRKQMSCWKTKRHVWWQFSIKNKSTKSISMLWSQFLPHCCRIYLRDRFVVRR